MEISLANWGTSPVFSGLCPVSENSTAIPGGLWYIAG